MIPLDKVKKIVSKYEALEKELASSNISKTDFVKKSKEYSSIGEIIDQARSYLVFEKEKNELEKITEDKKSDNSYAEEDDEFNVSLAVMEEEIKPKIVDLFQSLSKNYVKLKRYQVEKLNCILSSKELSTSKNKNLKKIQLILVKDFMNLQLREHANNA